MSKKSGNSKLKVVLAIVICIVLAIVVPTGIYCAVKQESPAKVIRSIVVSNEERIIGKWQNEARTSAYEFKENGTYESFFSTFSYTGDYSVKGDELTLSNPSSDSTVTYKIKVNKNELTMIAIKEAGLDTDESQESSSTYKRVDRIQTKSISQIFEDVTSQSSKNN
ncbi:DUF5640 domain-containing protein [uncultured Eubacterium sp.]|uniref:DUF5640 domain-containing protein n=1 Tax=uncultured Eubacterium sp. TaxID=165185 RepID=UPI0015B33FD3|nr:DUF5640 domain-containing protein [uncultured Eubacterium sp.]